MKQFTIKSSLAAGLSHRLNTMDGETVFNACNQPAANTPFIDAIEAIRANQRIVKKIEEANKVFMDAVGETEQKKRVIFDELQTKYKTEQKGKSTEESAKLGRDLTAEYNLKASEIQKASTANPDEVIAIQLSDDDYTKILLPVFKKTVQLWDVEGNGGGQKLFLQVADAIEAVTEV